MRIVLSAVILIIASIASASPMTFRMASDGGTDGSGWIVADGEITADTADDFRRFLKNRTDDDSMVRRTEVWFNSGGGSLPGGLKLGEAIREAGYGTTVGRSVRSTLPGPFEERADGKCESACVFAFLGGKFRNTDDRTLGVHQFYLPQAMSAPSAVQFTAKDLSDQQILAGILASYVAKMGVDARFLLQVSQTQPEEIYYLSTDEMKKFDIIKNDLEYSDWALQLYKDGLIAFTRTKNEERTATLFCRADHNLRLILTMPLYGKSNAEAAEIAKEASVSLFGATISPDNGNITGKIQNSKLKFELKLPPLQAFKQTNDGLASSGVTSRAFFYQNLPGANFFPTAKMVLHNCLS
jgi:hypothetical protein